MCLIRSEDIETLVRSSADKSGKLICYKVLSFFRERFQSIHFEHTWHEGVNNSDIEAESLDKHNVFHGIHVFLNNIDAIKELDSTWRVIPVTCYLSDLIASGYADYDISQKIPHAVFKCVTVEHETAIEQGMNV